MRHSRGPGKPQPSTYGTAWHHQHAPGWAWALGPAPATAEHMARVMSEQARRLAEEIRRRTGMGSEDDEQG